MSLGDFDCLCSKDKDRKRKGKKKQREERILSSTNLSLENIGALAPRSSYPQCGASEGC